MGGFSNGFLGSPALGYLQVIDGSVQAAYFPALAENSQKRGAEAEIFLARENGEILFLLDRTKRT